MRLLLDAHISPSVARQLASEGIDVAALRDWQSGTFLDAVDEEILTAALADNRVLVSFDRRTIYPLVLEWAASGRHHAGVVLIDRRTIRQNDIGGLVRALRTLIVNTQDELWEDRLDFLRWKTA